jgi:hypothetical protein
MSRSAIQSQNGLSLLEFQRLYGSEEQCEAALEKARWPDGFCSSQALSDRPKAIEPQGVHGQSAERGHDLHAVGLAVAVRVFPELGVAGQVPEVLDRPAVPNVLHQSLALVRKLETV